MIATGIAALLSLIGIASLYAGWRELVPSRVSTPLGWALVVVSFVPWIYASNVEFGIVFGMLSAAMFAWLLVGYNYETRRRADAPQATQPVVISTHGVLRNVGMFFVTVPLAGLCAVLLSVVIARLLPWSAVNALALGVLLLPVLWGLASYWACADEKPLRPTGVIGVTAALCAAWIYLE